MPIAIDWVPSDIWDKFAHFIKIFREADRAANASAHLEFAYSLTFDNRLRWAWTSKGGSFANENTKVTPHGPGSGKGDCRSVTCEKNQLKCSDGDRYWEKPHVSDDFTVISLLGI